MSKAKGNLVIIIFPYLFSEDEIELDNLTLWPSYKKNYDKQSNQVKGHVKRLAKSFAYGEYPQINQYLFSWRRIKNKTEWKDLQNTLDTFSAVAAFNELSDETNGSSFSNFNYGIFEILSNVTNKYGYYYSGLINGVSQVNIHYPDTKYRPNYGGLAPHILYQNNSLNKIIANLQHHSDFISPKERKSLLRAMSWFNKSFRDDPEIDDFEKFMDISVAFESLFNTSKEGIQGQILTGVTSLLGDSDEMHHWVRSFYDKRSLIIHGQENTDVFYTAAKTSSPHIDHINYSRKVFSRCIKVLIENREKYYVKDLHAELVSNERRLKNISELLNKGSKLPDLEKTEVFSVINSLSNKDDTGSTKEVINIGKKLLSYLAISKLKTNATEIKKAKESIETFTGKDNGNLAVLYNDLGEKFRKIYFDDTTSSLPLGFRSAIYTYTSYASWKLFRDMFSRKRKSD